MARRSSRRRRGSRRARRGPAGSIVPVYPTLYSPGHASGVLGRWLARRSRFGISRALVALIIVTVVIWTVFALAER